MTPDIRLTDGMAYELAGQVETSTAGKSFTASGTVNAKGSWTQLASGTARDATGIWVFPGGAGDNTDALWLIDIGVGAGGSEIVLIPNLLNRLSPANSGGPVGGGYFFPIHIPAGSRLSARGQCSVASKTTRVHCLLQTEGFASPSPFGRVTDYGTVAGSSDGTLVTSGINNAEGAWAQLVASTSHPIQMLLLAFGTTGAGGSLSRYFFDLGVGAAGSEVVVLEDLPLYQSSNSSLWAEVGPFPLSIPAGSRLAVRAQSSETFIAATCRAIAYGVD